MRQPKLPGLLQVFSFILLAAGLYSLYGCKSYANVTCTNVEKFQSRSGVINIPKFQNGDIIAIDTTEKVGMYLLHTQVPDSDISADAPIDSTVILTTTAFSIDLTGKIQKAAANIQAQAKSTINNNTTFFLAKSQRKNVKDPSSFINLQQYHKTLVDAYTNNKNVIFLYVSGIVYADQFEFRVLKSQTYNAQANIVKVGDFKVEVNYNCEGSLNIDARQGGIFFKSTFFNYNAASDRFLPLVADIDLSKYNLTNTLRNQ
jgi:hypothetical protein